MQQKQEHVITLINNFFGEESSSAKEMILLFEYYNAAFCDVDSAAFLAAYQSEDFSLAHYFVNKGLNLYGLLDDSVYAITRFREKLSVESTADLCKVVLELYRREPDSAKGIAERLIKSLRAKTWSMQPTDYIYLGAIRMFSPESPLNKVYELAQSCVEAKIKL
ncbi:MAG TPA: hypothetical protein VGV92_05000 [Gammaproteobacteria bacterium]|nr:hypothetical protein [Gammaproteobacteria bacterium]